ncbi:hypothetical protein ABZU86_30630 [Streptomyces sp. NPDC005271]|uniref:hypothetical protein n=1 Tax=unclassified Streptomyces TaxID=2593676 RepID=UPI0033B58BD7
MPGRLKAAVYVQDPSTREEVILLPGECPASEIAALVTNPDAWDVPPDDCESVVEPVPVAIGEPDPSTGKPEPEPEPEQEEAGGGGAKKPPSRRARSSSASS